jgi:hypothetical protein
MSTDNWTYEDYWHQNFDTRSAAKIVAEYGLTDETAAGPGSLDDWLGNAEAEAWLAGTDGHGTGCAADHGGELPESWSLHHERALEELREACAAAAAAAAAADADDDEDEESATETITRDAYLTTVCHAWSGQEQSRVDLWLEPDGTIRADDPAQGGNWSAPEWTTCHDIDAATQDRIRAAAAAAAQRRGQDGGELGFVRLS